MLLDSADITLLKTLLLKSVSILMTNGVDVFVSRSEVLTIACHSGVNYHLGVRVDTEDADELNFEIVFHKYRR